MELGIEKCTISMIMKIRKRQTTEGIKLTNQEKSKRIGEKKKLKVVGSTGSEHH